jgi:hypothetical protein
MIQRKWKKYILEKKIWSMLKPLDDSSVKMREREKNAIDLAFNKINSTTHFKTLIIVYNNDLTSNKTIEITRKEHNGYRIYQIDCDKIFCVNKERVINKLNKINNVVSIKIKAVINSFNLYGYPEIFEIKTF